MMRVVALVVALLLGGLTAGRPASAQPGDVTIRSKVLRSFDGTRIYTTLFLPLGASRNRPVPIVLRSHGWGGKGERTVTKGSTLDRLLRSGYAVLTWDQRGFGDSGDVAHLAAPEFERRDAQVLIDYVAGLPEIQLDGPRDPRVGFTGWSYAGGIQLVTAAFDARVDAIAPEIAWFNLPYSLSPNRVMKTGWTHALFHYGHVGAAVDGLDPVHNEVETGAYDPFLYRAYTRATATNEVDAQAERWLKQRSLAGYGRAHPVDVPTLVMQGSTDTLFNLNEGLAMYQHVRANGVPAKLIVFCGGHMPCPGGYKDGRDRDHLDQAILDWFAKYLKDRIVDTGAPVEYRTNQGVFRPADRFPPADVRTVPVKGEARLVSTAAPLSEGTVMAAAPNLPGDPRGASFEVAVAEGGPLEVVGLPSANLAVRGRGFGTHLFFKLVDREANHVLNLQETPLRIEGLSDASRPVPLDLVGVAYTLPQGHHLDLQVSTISLMHAAYRAAAEVRLVVEAAVPVRGPGRHSAPRTPAVARTAGGEESGNQRGDRRRDVPILPATGRALPAALPALVLLLARWRWGGRASGRRVRYDQAGSGRAVFATAGGLYPRQCNLPPSWGGAMPTDRSNGASVEQLRLGAGFNESERQDVIGRMRKLDRRLKRFDAGSVDLELSVKGRDTNEQHVVLEARVGGLERFVVTSSESELKDALNDVRDDLWRKLNDALGKRQRNRRRSSPA